MEKNCRPIAIYLPQYHPIPENDEWWGKGFTEWTNVTKAKPLFPGHHQPNLPADLGFYDLRMAEIKEQQAELAREAGIEGFCYWHYWFGNGRKIIERPITDVIQSGKPDFPFCLCWANATWSGIWYGDANRILMEQLYLGEKDYEAFFYDTLPAFKDKRYMKVDGKLLFVVYHPGRIPDWPVFVATFRRLAEKEGLPGIHFIGMEGRMMEGLDGATPNMSSGHQKMVIQGKGPLQRMKLNLIDLSNKMGRVLLKYPRIISYKDFVNNLPETPLPMEMHATILPNWDNTPRSGYRGYVLKGATPKLFQKQLEKAIKRMKHKPLENRLLFIKAWNEWAEGNYLEPDRKFGHGWLDACKNAFFKK
jgi:hypothetical protein